MKQIELKCRAVELVSSKKGTKYQCIEIQLPNKKIKKLFFDKNWNYNEVNSVMNVLENAPEIEG